MTIKSYPKIYFILLFIGFTIMIGNGLSSAFLSIMAKELDPLGVLAGFVISAWFISRIFTELPSGIISNRIGRQRLIMIGLAMGSCGSFICALSNSIYALILGRAIWGLGASLYFMSNTALILNLFEPRIRGRALGLFQGIEHIGSFIAAPIGAFMAVGLGSFNAVFYFATSLISVSFLLAFFSKDLRVIGKSGNSGPSLNLKKVLKEIWNWDIIVLSINSLTRNLTLAGITGTVFPIYLNQVSKLNIELIGIIMTTRFLGFILALFTSDYLSGKIGRQKTMIAAMFIEGAALYIYTAISRFEFFLLTAPFEGFGEGIVFTTLIIQLSETVPSQIRGGALGLYRTFQDIGGFTGPILLMFAFDNFGVTSPFFLSLAILGLNILLLATINRRK